MKAPDTPPEEESRLKTLVSLNILDTPPEERFDRLTRMAKRMFGVPIALVSLVDENRQWFKSCVGLDVTETPRDISFCGHAILGSDIFVIPDATKDERFADNPLVVNEPNIRFYAGCPLRSLNGSKMGTLCIIDQKPGKFDEEDLETLRDLASMVERELAAVQLATLDELTNITNRRGFMLLAKHSLSLCAREKIPASLIFLDLNKFKVINDEFGHAEGDRVLVAFAEQMRSVFRDSDVFARIGGDEFVVLLTHTSKSLAEDIVNRLRRSLDAYIQDASPDYEITFSYGVVEFDPDEHGTIGELLAKGDSLMYACKNQEK